MSNDYLNEWLDAIYAQYLMGSVNIHHNGFYSNSLFISNVKWQDNENTYGVF